MTRTPLFDWHVAHGGRVVEFAGWEMPVQYTSITDEHYAVRKAAGLFDISHMGRVRFTGPDACGLLDYLVTNDVTQLEPGQIRYALVTNESGGVLDDVLVYRFPDFYFLVVNASNREKILQWIESHRASFDATVEDLTRERCMLAIQGPRAVDILAPIVQDEIAGLKYYHAMETQVLDEPALVSRTGYTGEDGFEVIVAAQKAVELSDDLMARGADAGLRPCGLGCRDTLRLEAAMPLYGHELDETIDPFTAGLDFAVKLEAGEFIGREALIEIRNRPAVRKRVGLILEGRRIARDSAAVFQQERPVGTVSSGTFSPTLEKPIAMAYVEPDAGADGANVEVDIRGRRAAAVVTRLPFYKRNQT